MTDYVLRQATLADEAALYRICLETADAGGDATALYADPELAGDIWSVPYLHYAPRFCFVVASDAEVVGYIVGVADTAAFEAWLEVNWWPAVRARVAGLKPQSARERVALKIVNTPEAALTQITGAYPAHLHINLMTPARSGGWGRKLIERLCDAVQHEGAEGIHLGVDPRNENAIGFYKHVGFEMLDTGDPAIGPMMGKRL